MPIIMYVSSGSKFFVSPVTVIKVEIAFQARPESPRWQGLGLCLEISPDLNVAMHFFPSLFFFFPLLFLFFFFFHFPPFRELASKRATVQRDSSYVSFITCRIVSRKIYIEYRAFLRASFVFPSRWRIIVNARSFSLLLSFG